MVSASNLKVHRDESGESDSGEDSGSTTVLLLPSFTFVDHVTGRDIPELITRFVDASAGDTPVPRETSRLVSRPCVHDYVVLLCSHKRRDARCGLSAPLIKRELERHLRTAGLYRDADDERPGGVGIYYVSHVGGHKFSANVLVYRKKEGQMIWLARIRPEHCEGIVKYTILKGKVVHPESQLRGGFDRARGLTSW
jgi:(2Fe-2S) ferredoxin